jgi:Zn-dependent protease with chaperone function
MPRKRSNGELLLEWLQESVYAQLGTQPEIDRDEYRAVLERIANEMMQKYSPLYKPEQLQKLRTELLKMADEQMAQELPTRYENPLTYGIVLGLKQQIEEAAKELSMTIPIPPLVGTLPTGQVNAMAIPVPSSGEYLVVFESELFNFALLLSKAVIVALPLVTGEDGHLELSTNNADVEKHIAENPEAVDRFREVLFAYLFEGRPGAAPPYIPDPPYSDLASYLRDSLELFVMGHEYGHIIAGHVSAKQLTSTTIGGVRIDEYRRSWEEELVADSIGAALLLPAMTKRVQDLSLCYWGADFFFSCDEIIKRSLSIVITGEEKDEFQVSSSHPPSASRRQALRDTLKQQLPEDRIQAPLAVGRQIEQVIESLWNQTRSSLLEAHSQKRELAPVWKSVPQ